MISYPLKILVVEDNPHQAFAVEKSLRKHIEEIQVLTVATGEECIRGLSEEECSAVILDYNLPGMNGVELIEEIRRRGGRTRSLWSRARETKKLPFEP